MIMEARMADYKRARTQQQKAQRLDQIKTAAHELFLQSSYHAISLTTIAQKLGWSRAMLYKYVSTKEEIFLALCADQRASYFQALRSAYPPGAQYSYQTLAQVWSQILCCHRGYLCYSDILSSIIETNVSVDTLAAFKKAYHDDEKSLESQFAANLGISQDSVRDLCLSIHSHATGIKCCCSCRPLVQEAMDKAGLVTEEVDFASNMQDFILMCLLWHCKRPVAQP